MIVTRQNYIKGGYMCRCKTNRLLSCKHGISDCSIKIQNLKPAFCFIRKKRGRSDREVWRETNTVPREEAQWVQIRLLRHSRAGCWWRWGSGWWGGGGRKAAPQNCLLCTSTRHHKARAIHRPSPGTQPATVFVTSRCFGCFFFF